MRMFHYYLALALPASALLVATMVSGFVTGAPERHVGLGVLTAILCVATHTLLILFMIVTGRILKQAVRSRRLPPAFLAELNEFFARRTAYPASLGAATLTAATAVLGYGRNIGVPLLVHVVFGVAIVLLNPLTFAAGLSILRRNQALVDRAARALDTADAEARAAGAPDPVEPAGEPEEPAAFGPRTRWLAFALSAWLPYLYWALVVWRGDFGRVAPAFLVGTALASAAGLVGALRAG